jgi:hypothetical protein
VAFVDASRALEFEHKLLECVKAGTLDGTVQRTTGLSRTEVLSAWRRFVRSGADTLFVLCSNYRDFLFVANRDVLNDVDIIDLVTFDEDTVHFASPSLDVGFGVDRYHDSVAGWIYEIDAWGCQNPVQG